MPSHPRRRIVASLMLVGLLAGSLVGSAPVGAAGAPVSRTERDAALGAARPAQPRVDAPPGAFDATKVTLGLTRIVGTYSRPVLLTHAGDGTGRLFVVEQTGRIRIVKGAALVTAPFLDLSASISTGGERGLLGLAFHPAFETNKKFYVNLTLANGDTAINEYRWTTNPDRADWRTGRRIMTIDQPYANHNGGHLAFGPDGYLYIGMGDGGGFGDPGNRAQSLTTLLGKVLRIDVNATANGRNYAIPATNPWVNKGGWDEIWAYGLRNPWRWSFDRASGDLWIADVGQGRYEEVNRSSRSAGGGRGANYGWRVMEGRHCYSPPSGCNTKGKVLPLIEYGHVVSGDDNCSVTGGYVYRGSAYPMLHGGYLYGDFCSGRIWAVGATAPSPATPRLMLDTALNITSFGESETGHVYVTSAAGAVYRVTAAWR